MKIRQRIDGCTEAHADGRGLSKFLLGGALVFACLAAYHFLAGAAKSEQFTGSLCALALFVLALVVTYEVSSFVFDPSLRCIDWRRRTLFSKHSGRVDFDDVTCVVTETALDHNPTTGGGLSRRLALRTTSGTIPFTRAYTGDPDGTQLRIAARLNELFGIDAETEIRGRILELSAAGHEHAAARLVRAERGISLKAARDEVRRLSHASADAQQGAIQAGIEVNSRGKHHDQGGLPLDAIAALSRNSKVEAIQAVRMAQGLGLKAAKEVVERYLQEQQGEQL